MAKDARLVPLHVKSDRSIGEGVATVSELVRAAASWGLGALALTDVNNMYGQVELHHAARAAGVKAITGVELRGATGKSGRLVLVARDRAGYESLCRIVTARPSDPIACLEEDPHGLFFMSDDPGVIEALIARGVAPSDVRFLEVRPGPHVSAPRGIRVVADVDAVMIDPKDQELQRLLSRIRDPKKHAASGERSLSQCLRADELFSPEAIAETREIADACTLDLCDAPRVVPAFEGDADLALATSCESMRARDEARRARVDRELAVIRALGLAPYFLVTKAITDHLRAEGIPFAGRGSAASSLVCMALGITTIDPIENRLIFERFVRAGRTEPPDIDLDIPSNRRDAVVDWVFRRFGRDRVALVSTHQTFRRRSAYRAGLAALGMQREDIERFCARIPEDDDAAFAAPVATLPHHVQPFAPLVERLIGKMHHVSVHPGGIVIADAPLVKYAPLERAPKGVVVTQYDLRSIARLGLLKIDLLGNRALASLEHFREPSPDGDEATTALLRAGHTIGCFQVETAATRSVLRKLPVRGVKDLAAALALVRPGPSSADAKAAYVRRAHGEETGPPFLLFEEDIIDAIAAAANVSLERADAMRASIVAAEGDPIALRAVEREFLELAPNAKDTWRDLARFAAYSFNRAHALSYAELAWRSAYMKAHHPAEFACGVLNHYGGAYPLRTVAADFARHRVRILRPDVNRSQMEHVLEGGAVRLGLGAIKHLTKKSTHALLAARPISDMSDLRGRVELGERELRALVSCGACDELAPLSERAYPIAHEELLERGETTGRIASGPRADAYRALVRIRNEVTFLDMHPSDHPMRVLRGEAHAAGAVPIASIDADVGTELTIAGIVAASRRIETRAHGATMQFVTMEDETGVVEVVLFPGVYASLGDPVTNAGPFLVTGTVQDDHGDVSLTVTRVVPFHRRPVPWRRSA